MTFYIIFFAFAVAAMLLTNIIKDKKKKKWIAIAVFIMLTLVAGTRFELGGSDYYIYRKCFETVPDIWNLWRMEDVVRDIHLVNLFEPGYLTLNSIVKTLGFNFYGFTLIESTIWFVCMYHGLKRYVSDWTIVLIVFMYKLFMYNTFISLRQSITIALFFVALQYIEDKKWIQYYIISIIAFSFHNAGIILFLLYPVFQFKLTKKRLMIANVVCWTLYLFEKIGISIFNVINYVLGFVNSNSSIIIKAKQWLSVSIGLNLFHILEYMLLMILVVMYYEKIIECDKHAEFVLKIFLILLPLFTIFGGNVVSTRFKDFFTISYGIVLMYLCRIESGRLKWLVQMGTIAVCLYGYVRYLMNFDAGGLLPYVSYISKGISIFQ